MGICAFIGAIVASIIILLIAEIAGNNKKLIIIVTGFAVNATCASVMSLLITMLRNSQQTRSVQFWLMGSLMINDWTTIVILGIVILLGTLFFISQWRILDLMVVGDEISLTMGKNLAAWRKIYIMVVAIMVSSMVYVSGIIGFVGLLIPHCVRIIIGSGHHKLVPFCALTGGCFLIFADIFGRNVLPGTYLPIGVTASLSGAPVFVWLLVRGKYGAM